MSFWVLSSTTFVLMTHFGEVIFLYLWSFEFNFFSTKARDDISSIVTETSIRRESYQNGSVGFVLSNICFNGTFQRGYLPLFEKVWIKFLEFKSQIWQHHISERLLASFICEGLSLISRIQKYELALVLFY